MRNGSFGNCVAVLLLLTGPTGGVGAEPSEQQAGFADHRQLVEMPVQAQRLMRKDMQEHLAALSEILGHLANDELAVAAKVAEEKMGRSSMGRHRGTGMGPGRFMPPAMRQIGWGMHEAATHFAEVAERGDPSESYAALHKVVASCNACHLSFRIR